MQTQNKIFEDISQLMTNAMGVAQGAKDEAETAMKGWIDRWLADRDLVTREEFDAVRTMAEKARVENKALKARITKLEKAVKERATARTAQQMRSRATIIVDKSGERAISPNYVFTDDHFRHTISGKADAKTRRW